MTHPTLPLERFSPRARQLLLSAERRKVERDPDAIAAKLRACHRPVWASVINFEQTYGGLWWPEGYGDDELGIHYTVPVDEGDEDPLKLDLEQVPIGALGVSILYMNEAGEVTESLSGRRASIDVHLEQTALSKVADWPRSAHVRVTPPSGEHLAKTLGLDPAREATDRYSSWWTSDDIRMRHVAPEGEHYAVAGDASYDLVITRALDATVRVLDLGATLITDSRFFIIGTGELHKLSPEDWARIPDPQSWGSMDGARCYRMGTAETVLGVIWVLGQPGAWEVQEYRIDPENGVISWTTMNADGATERRLRPG